MINVATGRDTATGFIPTSEAAKLLGVIPSSVKKLAQNGRLRGIRTADGRRDWLIDPTSIAEHLSRPEVIARRRQVRKDDVTEFFVNKAGNERFPLNRLLARIDSRGRALSAQEIARSLNVNSGLVHRARSEGLTARTADRWAIQLGYHPGEIWPEWWTSEHAAREREASMHRHPSARRAPEVAA